MLDLACNDAWNAAIRATNAQIRKRRYSDVAAARHGHCGAHRRDSQYDRSVRRRQYLRA
jgi:hypothetical protein